MEEELYDWEQANILTLKKWKIGESQSCRLLPSESIEGMICEHLDREKAMTKRQNEFIRNTLCIKNTLCKSNPISFFFFDRITRLVNQVSGVDVQYPDFNKVFDKERHRVQE